MWISKICTQFGSRPKSSTGRKSKMVMETALRFKSNGEKTSVKLYRLLTPESKNVEPSPLSPAFPAEFQRVSSMISTTPFWTLK